MMGIEVFFIAVLILLVFACADLVVGVANDAVNFLNSSIGSKVASYKVILTVASCGVLAGVTFSSGMMEVARKGIFHPQFFTMPELITIFMALMITDILLLDVFNTYGLPTSTTVSLVFGLLGAAVAVSVIKIMHANGNAMFLGEYINTGKAMIIVFGILLSIVIAFFSGAIIQFVSRLIFTFDYEKRLKRYGALWGGLSISVITFFILLQGVNGASFMTPEITSWINTHFFPVMVLIFIVSSMVFQSLVCFFRVNILKPIILVGTFALAMAFAANDLVNFIGAPTAALYAFKTAMASGDPLNVTMGALNKTVRSETSILLISGVIMVITLWVSKKAKTVTETEVRLGQQDEGIERFESIWLSRSIVNMADSFFSSLKTVVPLNIREFIGHRIKPRNPSTVMSHEDQPSFDLVRASVNLIVSSALVSMATAMKLPLSTTYVTFMVAMGTSFADQAWGRESAVYRVTGVLTVIGGWFVTAFVALIISFVFANIIFYFKVPGTVALMVLLGIVIWKNYHKHKGMEKEKEEIKIFNMKKIMDSHRAISNTFEHMAYLLKDIRESFDVAFDALFDKNIYVLSNERTKKVKQIQRSSNIIMANIFKVLRLLQKEDVKISYRYAQTIRRLQKLSDGHRDTIMRSYMHVGNKHNGLLDAQIEELKKIKICILDILLKVETSFHRKEIVNYSNVIDQYNYMRELANQFHQEQMERIRRGESKTRLSILFYAIVGNCLMMAKQNIKLLEIFNESFQFDKKLSQSYVQLDSH